MTSVQERIQRLVQEISDGEYKKERFLDMADELRGEYQTEYFSHARENMKTDMAHILMNRLQT